MSVVAIVSLVSVILHQQQELNDLDNALEITSQTLYDKHIEYTWLKELADYWRDGGQWGKDGQHSKMLEKERMT